MRDPSVKLQTYDGTSLPMLGKADVALKVDARDLQMTVLVQDEAPQHLLLGTDCLSKLESSFSIGNRELRVVEKQPESQSSREMPRVKLLTPTRVPAKHARVVRAVCEGATSVMLLEPTAGQNSVALIEPMLVEPDERGEFTMVLKNTSTTPAYVEAGEEIAEASYAKMQATQDVDPAQVKLLLPNESVCSNRMNEEAELLKTLNLDKTRLTLEERDQLATLVLKFKDVFTSEGGGLGSTSVVQHRIDTGDAAPIKQYARRIPHAVREKVQSLVAEMLDRNVISPTRSPWASPIVLVSKRDGGTRFCVDYRKLNSVTKPDVFPLPRIDDCLDVLSGTRYFSTLDLSSGFW